MGPPWIVDRHADQWMNVRFVLGEELRRRSIPAMGRGHSAAALKNRRQSADNGRVHRTLRFSTKSVTGRLQGTSATEPERCPWRVWVDSAGEWPLSGTPPAASCGCAPMHRGTPFNRRETTLESTHVQHHAGWNTGKLAVGFGADPANDGLGFRGSQGARCVLRRSPPGRRISGAGDAVTAG